MSQVEGKGSHYSLVLQPCPPPSTQSGEEGEKKKKRESSECRQLSLIFHQDAVFSGDSICVVNILKRFPRLPSPFLLPLFYLFIPPLSLSLSLTRFSSSYFLNCLTPKIQISQLGPPWVFFFFFFFEKWAYYFLHLPFLIFFSLFFLVTINIFHLYANYYLLTKDG